MKTYKDLLNEEFRAENIIREKRILKAEIKKAKGRLIVAIVVLGVGVVAAASVIMILLNL